MPEMKFTRKNTVNRPKAFPNNQNANAANLDWVHCLGWRLRNNPEDYWTALVTRVKDRESSDVQNAAKCMAIYVKSLKLKYKHIYVVPIISSGDEQACEDDPSTIFSRTVAEAVGGICVVDALEKQPYSSLHSGRKSASERDSLVAGAYTCTGFDFPADCAEPLILIVDDIVTRGSTMNDAARAIRAKYGDLQIGGLALAKWQWQETNCSNDHLGYFVDEIIFGEIQRHHVAKANGELIAAYEDDIAVESADGDDPLLTLINHELSRAAVIDRNEPVDEQIGQLVMWPEVGNEGSYDANGHDEDVYDEDVYDEDVYDEDGYNEDGFDEFGFDEDGFDEDGFDANGYDAFGFDVDGYNADGYTKDGLEDGEVDEFDDDVGYTWGGTFISGSDDAPDEVESC